MSTPSESEKQLTFSCSNCDFVVDYHYKGKKPPFSKHILLHENCFVIKDPFSTSGGFICVGAICSMCQGDVCMSNECSLYYTRRFCLTCAEQHVKEFPMEVQREICNRRKK